MYFTSIWWVFAYGTGLLIGCIYTVLWEIGFLWYHINPIALLLWSTLYSIPVYSVILLSFGAQDPTIWESQKNGLQCFFEGHNTTLNSCASYSWVSVSLYSLSSLISDIIQIYMVSLDTAYFLIIADTLATPVIAIIFSLHVFGQSSEPLTAQSIVAVVLITLGILIYKYPQFLESYKNSNGCSNICSCTKPKKITSFEIISNELTDEEQY